MAKQTDAGDSAVNTDFDPAKLAAAFANVAEKSSDIVSKFLQEQGSSSWTQASNGLGHADPLNIGQAFFEMSARLAANPAALAESNMRLWQSYMDLWQGTSRKMMGQSADPVIEPDSDDRRFKDDAWSENPLFDYIKQSYLLSAKWLHETVKDVDGLDDKTAKKVEFYTRQFVDAMAPTNFAATNPEVLRATAESGGENLVNGLQNLLADLERGNGSLRISQTDEKAFTVGKNLAVTEGKVVFRNDLIELIQYAPTTEKVAKRPLLIVPPWINKYYILDLTAKKSFISWCVSQGLTVFAISWVNPDASLAELTFEDYLSDGLLKAISVSSDISGEKNVNVVGYCLGGTLLASALGYLAAAKKSPIKSATFLTAMIDFTEAGELEVFIDEEQLLALEEKMAETGYLEGSSMANTFNMLRANDLIWSFVINNYLLGKDPFPFDLLYWNSDSTRMPADMHSYYLRNMYQKNLLAKPGGLQLLGKDIDLSNVKTPVFFLSTQEDHIAPWQSTYDGMQILQGPKEFCLAGSGHIAGVVNPPAADKYFHYQSDATPDTAQSWLDDADKNSGSWWPHWRKWLNGHDGGAVDARTPGSGDYPALTPAPGTYVGVKSADSNGK